MATTQRISGRQALRDGGGVLLLALVLFSVRVSEVPAVAEVSPDDAASPAPAAQQVLALPAAQPVVVDDDAGEIRWENVTREANRWIGIAEEELGDEHPELQRRLKQVRKFVTFVETTHAAGAACPNEPAVRDAIRTARGAIETGSAEVCS